MSAAVSAMRLLDPCFIVNPICLPGSVAVDPLDSFSAHEKDLDEHCDDVFQFRLAKHLGRKLLFKNQSGHYCRHRRQSSLSSQSRAAIQPFLPQARPDLRKILQMLLEIKILIDLLQPLLRGMVPDRE